MVPDIPEVTPLDVAEGRGPERGLQESAVEIRNLTHLEITSIDPRQLRDKCEGDRWLQIAVSLELKVAVGVLMGVLGDVPKSDFDGVASTRPPVRSPKNAFEHFESRDVVEANDVVLIASGTECRLVSHHVNHLQAIDLG